MPCPSRSCVATLVIVYTFSAVLSRAADEPAKPAAEAPSNEPAKPAQEAQQPSIFDLPAVQAMQVRTHQVVAQLMSKGEYEQAAKALQEAVQRVPHDFTAQYNLACALARLERKDDALVALHRAVELGFRDANHIKADEDLKALRDDDRFTRAVALAAQPLEATTEGWKYPVDPGVIENGQVLITEKDVAWDARLGLFRGIFKLDRTATADKPIANGLGPAGDLLRQWYKEGTAAGNHGDLYDNHDTDHSNMDYNAFPQLTRIEFDDAAKKRGLHHGLQRAFLYNGVTLGNSSTALTSGPFWRSQPRFALTQPRGPELLYVQYRSNHIYMYPEHRDHDPGHNGADGKGHGDVIPANTPYMIVSQGSSGSDRPFMAAVAATLAAFRPDVKAELARTGTLMPAVQMVFRMSNKMVATPEDYLTGKAHPTVFDGGQIDLAKMVTLAHDITADAFPPLVQIKFIEEDEPVVGREYFDIGPREQFFDTPCAIARVVKSSKYARRMVISAEDSKDLHDKPLTYQWVFLRGDTDRITINKLNDNGSRVELIVPYHERRPILPGAEMESNRVDIGVFVNNGTYFSAPAFVSLLYLDNEKRVYDNQHRIQSIDYVDESVRGNYVDPALDFQKDWRDEYHYGDNGALTGWTRIRGDKREEFTADGLLVTERDNKGTPTKTAQVRYVAERREGRVGVITEQIVESTSK